MFLGLAVRELLDDNRRTLRQQLDRFENVVNDIKTRPGKGQPDRDEFKIIDEINNLFSTKHMRERYPDERQRRDDLTRELLRHRWLDVAFQVKDPQTREPKPVGEKAFSYAREMLSLAIGKDVSPWTIPDPAGGLWVQDTMYVPIGIGTLPFGVGDCYAMVTLLTSDGFAMRISEPTGRPRHVTTLELKGEQVLLTTREDDRPPQLLFTQALPAGAPQYNLSFGIQVKPSGIRFLWGEAPPKSFSVSGLREGASAAVEMQLPRNTRLRAIGIWPNGPNK